jgi:hypothetical protein
MPAMMHSTMLASISAKIRKMPMSTRVRMPDTK